MCAANSDLQLVAGILLFVVFWMAVVTGYLIITSK